MSEATMNTLHTTSDPTGTSIRPELIAESFFFIDKSGTYSQETDGKFGSVDSGNFFRTTSKISYSGKVFAICSGQVLLQPNSQDNTKVNLILRPFRQPINGLAIKYIIYRGLKKTDFLTTNEKEILPKGTSATGFVNNIREEFEHFISQNSTETIPLFSKYIGYPNSDAEGEEIQMETDSIDQYFFKISLPKEENGEPTAQELNAFELPMIAQGTYLGNADMNLGIDIVLNEGDFTIEIDSNPFKLNLAFARSADHKLDPAGANSDFEKKLIRESATQFLDVASFYGLHAQGKGKVFVNSQTDPLTSEDSVYNLINKFSTKNTTYLCIQSSRQRSYNFYGNYDIERENNNTVDIKLSTDGTNFIEEKFNENWPVREFPNQPPLALQLSTDNYAGAGLYVKQGILNTSVTSHEDYFIRDKNLLVEADSGNTTEFIKPIAFDFIKSGNNIISSFIQLIYEGKQISVTSESTDPNVPAQLFYMKDIDDVFGLINTKPLLQPQNTHQLAYVVDQNLLLINFENKTGGKDIATVTTKRVEDKVMKDKDQSLVRVTYETLLNNIRQNTGSFFQSGSAYLDNSNSGMISYSKNLNNFYKPESPYYLQTEVFTGTDGNTITGLSLHVEDGSLPSKKLLGITEPENTIFKELIETNALNNPKFFFKNELEDEESYFTSSEGVAYRRYSLCINGEDQSGYLKFFEPQTKVLVITIDNMVFASEQYSKWMPRLVRDGLVMLKLKL
ncbi:hypothetical protein [Chryseobacterium sp. MP_3.2]|uniref:hypothetical protein n=1 Tax=Chryseobacterium sp. MP_3.2 TaxID=3071712 RepID=UPI002DFD676D|nr:hypothetical protein [Chryseobacterium sp. MP_3.2]